MKTPSLFSKLTAVLCLLSSVFVPVSGQESPSYTAYRLPATQTLNIDGDLSDWPDVPPFLIGTAEHVASGPWGGPEDAYALVRILWNSEALYMGIVVSDDDVIQSKSRAQAHSIWMDDSIQWAVDIKDDGGTGIGYGDDNYEFSFGKADGEPVAYRSYASSGWPKGIAEHIKIAIRDRPQGGLVYEAEIDWAMLAPLRNPEADRTIGFSLVLQDLDKAAKTTLEWTPGITQGKNPSQFGNLTFSPATAGSGASGLLLSAADSVGKQGLDLRAIPTDTDKEARNLFVQLTGSDGALILREPLPLQEDGSYQTRIQTDTLAGGVYHVFIQNEMRENLARHTFSRGNLEGLEGRMERITRKLKVVEELLTKAEAAGVQIEYPRSGYTTAKIFAPFLKEDYENGLYELTQHNAEVVEGILDREESRLRQWMSDPNSFPDYLRVPLHDFTQVEIKGRHLVVDGQPVMMSGPLTWLWEAHSGIERMADMGYPTMRFDWSAKHHFDKEGNLIPAGKLPYWAARATLKAGNARNMSMGFSMTNPEQVWRGVRRRGEEVGLETFHEIYDHYVERTIQSVGTGLVKDYTISVESQRAQAFYTPHLHHDRWVELLKSHYLDLEELNRLYGTSYSRFEEVPFPESLPKNEAMKFDYTRMRQIRIADELTRAARKTKEQDPGTILHGYPYVWTFRDPAAFYQHALDPELDMEHMDMVGCDTSGSHESRRYAMATITWLAGYYDLMRSIADDRPLNDGEFHFANHRKIYPENWARAIHFQGFVHGLSMAYYWVWARNASLSSSIMFDAAILEGTGQAALDLRRASDAIAAFHNRPNDVVLLCSNASVPHTTRTPDGAVLSQLAQTDKIYEGLYFEGLQVGYVTEVKVDRGYLDRTDLLIVPNSSHVPRSVRSRIVEYAENGGLVLLVGTSLAYTPQGADLDPLPEHPNLIRLPAMKNADHAREILLPYLEQAQILPAVQVGVENGLPYPTVEWRFAKDRDDSSYLFLLNYGHGDATATLPPTWIGAQDLLTGEILNQDIALSSLEFRMLRKQPDRPDF